MSSNSIAVIAVLAVAVIGCDAGAVDGGARTVSTDGEAADSETPDSTALEPDAEMSCVEAYDLETLGNRSFAFDGTVTNIGGDVAAGDPYIYVTFDVHEWFRGEGGAEVDVQMWPPGEMTSVETATYQTGTRLLVAGEPRWGGAPLESPIAWPCGFTRTHTDEVADTWRSVLASSEG